MPQDSSYRTDEIPEDDPKSLLPRKYHLSVSALESYVHHLWGMQNDPYLYTTD